MTRARILNIITTFTRLNDKTFTATTNSVVVFLIKIVPQNTYPVHAELALLVAIQAVLLHYI